MNVRYFEKRGTVWLDFRDHTGVRRRLPTGASDQATAEKLAPVVIARALSGTTSPLRPTKASVTPSGPTLESAFRKAMQEREKWMQAKDKGTLVATFEAITAGNRLRPGSLLSVLTRDFVRELRSEWLKEPGKRRGSTLSASTVNHRLSMLSALLEAYDYPPHAVKHLSVKGTARHRRVTDAEFAQATQWAQAEATRGRSGASEFARLLVAGWETGARLSELLNLQEADVEGWRVTFRDTKNGLTRTIPLTPPAQAALGPCPTRSRPFPTLTPDRVTTLWALMRADMGLAEDQLFVFHILRHERASRFADEGKGAHFIKAVLGHENIKTSESYVNMSVAGLATQMGVEMAAA